jgi:HEAT repeats
VTALMLAAALALGQGRITNAQVDTRTATQSLEREIAGATARGGARWIGYRLKVSAGRRSMDCFDRTRVALESATEFSVLARYEGTTLTRLRTTTPDCEIDAGGVPVTWIDNVKPDDSAAWLTSVIKSAGLSSDRQNAVVKPALVALAMQEGNVAARSLIDLARDYQVAKIRSEALFWLAQRAGQQAAATIVEAIDRDPDTEVKKRAVFALSQLPKDEGVPKLIEVAKANRNAAVRQQAMFWLGQSNDPRALKFFEDVLLK